MAILLCLEGTTGPLTDKQRRMLMTAREECERLQTTVDQVLDLARIQSGQMEVARRRIGAVALVGAAIAGVERVAHEREVRLESELPDSLPELDVDAERLQLALGNLILNAVRYSETGSVVRVRATPSEDRIHFSVLDRGRGVPESQQPLIFEKFYRVPGTSSPGVGLGLAIAREIVLAHGGEIGVSSRVGGGSEFWLTVPLPDP
jgi:signal transduction histidine kinase